LNHGCCNRVKQLATKTEPRTEWANMAGCASVHSQAWRYSQATAKSNRPQVAWSPQKNLTLQKRDISPPSSTQVKNAWNYTSKP